MCYCISASVLYFHRNLSLNALTTLPDGLFANQKNLKYL